LGGGVDKASRLAGLIGRVDQVEYHWALATIAERRKDMSSAEEHLRRAMELAPLQVSRVLDLAKFLSKQGRDQESETFFAKAEKMAPDDPKVLFAHANNLIRTKKDMPTAKLLLEKYLKAPLTPEDPSREEAQKLLKQASGA
jgi:Flp pilus assembly protein TadD